MNYNQIIYQIYPLGFCDCPKTNDFFISKRLNKINDWLDYFSDLKVTTILFNPLFSSTAHGYDTIDYLKVDERLGTNEDLIKLCHNIHHHKMNIIFDGVFNHVGRDFWAFKDVLNNKENSDYRYWFNIDFNNLNGPDGFYYDNWEGHNELVKLNLDNPEVREYLFMVVDNWISNYKLDGLRLDVAYMLNKQFMKELIKHVKNINPNFMFIGEMIGGDYNLIMNDGLCDVVTNYECRKGLYSSFNEHNLYEIAYSLNRQFGKEEWCLYRDKHLLSFVDNHDVNRISSVLKDERDLPLIYDLMYAMNGIPCVYYGSEWGVKGERNEYNDYNLRPSFDTYYPNELTNHIKQLNEIRLNNMVFTFGHYQQIYINNEQLIFKREYNGDTLIFALNISDNEVDLYPNIDDSFINLFDNKKENLSQIHLNGKESKIYLKKGEDR